MCKKNDYMKKWDIFKKTLPHMAYPYSKRNWGNALHSVCSYQGKMKPSLAYHLVEVFSLPGDTVLDLFSGSGTIPFEAALNGRYALGLDIGLLATSISNAKIMNPSKNKTREIFNELERYIAENEPSEKSLRDSQEIKFNKTIKEYFHPDTLREILIARDFFSSHEYPESAEWALILSCMLHILHGNRPYALSRKSHPITPYAPTGEFIYKNLGNHLWTKVSKSLETDKPSSFIEGTCYKIDILNEWPDNISQLDAIITSPPFFDSTKFYMTNWMRYWFCGWGKADFEIEPKKFIEHIQKQSFDKYDHIFRSSHDRLKKGGVAVFHLGNSEKCDMGKALIGYAEKYFEVKDLFTESVSHCEKHGIVDKGSVKNHQYLILEKK